MPTAQAVTGVTGHILSGGFDLANLRTEEHGVTLAVWKLEFRWRGKATLDHVLRNPHEMYSDSLNKLAFFIQRLGIPSDTPVRYRYDNKRAMIVIGKRNFIVYRNRVYDDYRH